MHRGDKPMDAGWFRCAAASAMLRLARGYDHIIGSELYVELALSLQVTEPKLALHAFLAVLGWAGYDHY